MHPAYQLVLKSIQQCASIDEQAFLASQQHHPHTSIYVNADKIKDLNCLTFGISEPVSWAKNAYYLDQRPSFYLDPLFYAGAYYVMDASSMFLHYILTQLHLAKDAVVLDIAAAPGGKSILISDYLNEEGILWSNEVNYHRAKTLHYNLSKWGKSNFIITNNDSKHFAHVSDMFDAVVCDAPCTGSGLFRKYPEWKDSFNQNLIQQCEYRQKQILNHLFSSIKENGYLIYSTCSFCYEENENISTFILQNGFEYVDIPIPSNFGIIKTPLGIRFFPHLTKTEGFFYAVFRKKEKTMKPSHHSPTRALSIKAVSSQPFNDYLNLQNAHKIYLWKDRYYLSNRIISEYLSNSFKYLALGTSIGRLNSIPEPELAFSLYLSNNVPRIDVSKDQALHYLKKENIPISAPKGIYLITYKDLGLGWVKVLDNRINNYLPSEWRILKDIEIEY